MKKKSKLKPKNKKDFCHLKLDLEQWEEKVIALQVKYGAVVNFNLIYHLKGLPLTQVVMDKMVKKLRQESKDYITLEKVVRLERKKIKLLKKVSEPFKAEVDSFFANTNEANLNVLKSIYSLKLGDSSILFNFNEKITKTFINTCFLFGKNAAKKTKGKNYHYPKQQLYLYRLICIYHQMTGIMPKCETNRTLEKGDKGYDEYKGEFYKFLLDVKPILEDLDVYLGTKKTIGKYANILIGKYKEKLLFTKTPPH